MGLFQKIFSKAARKSYFPPPPAEGPPQPEGYWSIIVDENGDRVTNRPPAATDFIARPAVEYIDGGTHPPYTKNPALNESQNVQNLVDYEIRAHKNREHLQKAVFLLSQTDDGARLLRLAKDMKFTIVFDPEQVAEEKAVGLMDYANKKIPLAEGRSAAEVALTLKHELQHMEDVSKGLSYGLQDKPKNAQLVNRALEGNARVSESVAAAEAMMGSPHGPARQFRTAALFNNLWHKNPEIGKAAYDALDDAAAGKWTSFAAKILPAYFTQESTLAYYDERYAKFIDKYVPDVANSIKGAAEGDYRYREAHKRRVEQTRANAQTLFTLDRWTPDKISALLTIRNHPYMNGEGGKGFSLASDAAIALTKGAPALFAKIKANIEAVLPGSDKPAQLDMPVMPDKKPVAYAASPYNAWQPVKLEEEFQPIRMPDRIDGMMMTDGNRANAYRTEVFNDEYNRMKTGGTDLDRVNFTVSQYFYNNRGGGNYRGLVSGLVDAGLRAPIGAFPDEYLFDLYGRMAIGVRNGTAGQKITLALSPQELQLVDHWQQLSDKGFDPVWIDAKHEKDSWVSQDKQIIFYAKHLAAGLKPPGQGKAGDASPDAHQGNTVRRAV